MVSTKLPRDSSDSMSTATETLKEEQQLLATLSSPERLSWAVNRFEGRFALTTSFGIQSAVLLHMLSSLKDGDSVPVIWVDTGYLPEETYQYSETLQGF